MIRAVLAIKNIELENFILTTHQDVLVVARVNTLEQCIEQVALHKPELLVVSDMISPDHSWEDDRTKLELIQAHSPRTSVLYLFLSGVSNDHVSTLEEMGFFCVTPPIVELEISQKIYQLKQTRDTLHKPATIAVWSPKPGDGGSLVSEALAWLFWENKEKNETIALIDFNLRTPFLKYRINLKEVNVLDELLPYINADCLSVKVLLDHTRPVWQREDFRFIGGIRRPELKGCFNAVIFNHIIETAENSFAKIIIDAGNIPDHPGTIMALKNADLILAVLQPNDISRICLQNSLQFFPALGINPNKTGVLLNRYSPETVLHSKMITGGVNMEVLGCLPDLGPESNNIGEESIFVAGRSDKTTYFMQCLLQAVEKVGLSSETEKKKKAGLWPQLFGKGGMAHVGKTAG